MNVRDRLYKPLTALSIISRIVSNILLLVVAFSLQLAKADDEAEMRMPDVVEPFRPGWYNAVYTDDLEIKTIVKAIADLEKTADKFLSFSSVDKVKFSNQTNENDYVSPAEMLGLLKQEEKKDLLVIHLEKRFEFEPMGKDQAKRRKLAEAAVIGFAKEAGYKRCLILADHASATIVVADLQKTDSNNNKSK